MPRTSEPPSLLNCTVHTLQGSKRRRPCRLMQPSRGKPTLRHAGASSIHQHPFLLAACIVEEPRGSTRNGKKTRTCRLREVNGRSPPQTPSSALAHLAFRRASQLVGCFSRLLIFAAKTLKAFRTVLRPRSASPVPIAAFGKALSSTASVLPPSSSELRALGLLSRPHLGKAPGSDSPAPLVESLPHRNSGRIPKPASTRPWLRQPDNLTTHSALLGHFCVKPLLRYIHTSQLL